MDAAHSLLLSPQSPRPALLSPIYPVVISPYVSYEAVCRDAAQIEHFQAEHFEQSARLGGVFTVGTCAEHSD